MLCAAGGVGAGVLLGQLGEFLVHALRVQLVGDDGVFEFAELFGGFDLGFHVCAGEACGELGGFFADAGQTLRRFGEGRRLVGGEVCAAVFDQPLDSAEAGVGQRLDALDELRDTFDAFRLCGAGLLDRGGVLTLARGLPRALQIFRQLLRQLLRTLLREGDLLRDELFELAGHVPAVVLHEHLAVAAEEREKQGPAGASRLHGPWRVTVTGDAWAPAANAGTPPSVDGIVRSLPRLANRHCPANLALPSASSFRKSSGFFQPPIVCRTLPSPSKMPIAGMPRACSFSFMTRS